MCSSHEYSYDKQRQTEPYTELCKRFIHISHTLPHYKYNNPTHNNCNVANPFPSIGKKNESFLSLPERNVEDAPQSNNADLIFKQLMILKLILFLLVECHRKYYDRKYKRNYGREMALFNEKKVSTNDACIAHSTLQ